MTKKEEIFDKMLFEPIYVPIETGQVSELKLMTFPLAEATIALAFSSILKLARFCGEKTEFLETTALELFGQLIAQSFALGFDFEDDEGEIYDVESLKEFLASLENGVTMHQFESTKFNPPKNFSSIETPLAQMLSTFLTCPRIGVVETQSAELVFVVLERDLSLEISLFAKLQQFARSQKHHQTISILKCADFEGLGSDFSQNAQFITPQKIPKPSPKPPILRY